MLEKSIPILRIFDETKAREFYIDFLGFKVDFEHRFEKDMPLYMGISRDNIQLHLSEHHGDASPGSTVFVICNEIRKYHEELSAKNYKYYRPGVEETFYGTLCMGVHDPFGNRLSFNEYIK